MVREVQRLKAEAGRMVALLAAEYEEENLTEERRRSLTAEVGIGATYIYVSDCPQLNAIIHLPGSACPSFTLLMDSSMTVPQWKQS